jgi:hypothetical protein
MKIVSIKQYGCGLPQDKKWYKLIGLSDVRQMVEGL